MPFTGASRELHGLPRAEQLIFSLSPLLLRQVWQRAVLGFCACSRAPGRPWSLSPTLRPQHPNKTEGTQSGKAREPGILGSLVYARHWWFPFIHQIFNVQYRTGSRPVVPKPVWTSESSGDLLDIPKPRPHGRNALWGGGPQASVFFEADSNMQISLGRTTLHYVLRLILLITTILVGLYWNPSFTDNKKGNQKGWPNTEQPVNGTDIILAQNCWIPKPPSEKFFTQYSDLKKKVRTRGMGDLHTRVLLL